MNFVVLSDYYAPIIKSGSIIVGDLATELIRQGHEVTIITFVNTQKEKCQITVENSIKVIRIRASIRGLGMIGRLFSEISYSFKIIKILKSYRDIMCDGVICYSPSIFYGRAVSWLKKSYRCKSYLVIRDIFPKWALESGLLSKGLLSNFFSYIEKKLYSSSDLIGIEAKSDLSYFNEYGLNKEINIEVLNNWGTPIIKDEITDSLKIFDIKKVNIVYGGNMGDAQDLLSLLNIIDLEILGSRAIITLMGSGNQFSAIRDKIIREEITNIVLLPPLNFDEYLSALSDADVGLVSLGSQMLSNNCPLKMIGYMQHGKPILASVNKNNEIIKTINENNIGLVSIASDAKKFNENLDMMITQESVRVNQGINSLKLFNDQYTVSFAVKQICGHFL